MSQRRYEDIYYENDAVQTEFNKLLQRLDDAQQARAPIVDKHRKAEFEEERGAIPFEQYRESDDAFIAANNAIAAAQRAIEQFLNQHPSYKTRS